MEKSSLNPFLPAWGTRRWLEAASMYLWKENHALDFLLQWDKQHCGEKWLLFHTTSTVYKIRLTRTLRRSVWKVLQLAKKNPDIIEQTESWLINEQLWRKWPSRLVEKWNIRAVWPCFREGQLQPGLCTKSKGWSQADTWSAACPSQFWMAKDKKEVKCWHKPKIIREHSTSRDWENWFWSSEHNLT